jgi:hypothetical protein
MRPAILRRLARLNASGVIMVALAAGGAVACRSGTADGGFGRSTMEPHAVTSSQPSPLPVSPEETAQQQALAAYRGMVADFVAAGRTSDWQSPHLAEHATGIALTNLTRALYADRLNRVVTRGEPGLNPNIASADPSGNPTTVILADCTDSTRFLKYHADNGQPADDGPGGHQLMKTTVQKQSDGSWKVSDFGIQGVGSC